MSKKLFKNRNYKFKVKKYNLIKKRCFDIFVSIFAILIFFPLMMIIAILIKIKSPDGEIIFKQKRLGKNGKEFYIYKFRTMILDADKKLQELLDNNLKIKEEFDRDFKLKNDPRIIPVIGSFLRKTSLDELPQFFNSLNGTMSIIGPRPIVKDELEKYGEFSNKFLSVKPGISGLWQISGRNDISYKERISLDMKYIDNQSLLLDIKIMFKTVLLMISKKGSY